MPRYAYVNGQFVPHGKAAVHIEDRGFQFSDGVYEVFAILDSRLVDETGHLERLSRSLGELRIAPPMGDAALKLVMRQLVARNRVQDGLLYLQITRGVAPRDFKFPARPQSSLVMTTRRQSAPAVETAGIKVVSVPDIRWARRDIKSVGLLAQVLAKQAAAEAGAAEAFMVDKDGLVTEGGSSNAWIVTMDGTLVTRPSDHSILKGITGNSLSALAAELGYTIARRAFTLDEAKAAREVFISSATTFCLPVVAIDGQPVANGHPGEVARRLRARYLDYAQQGQGRDFPWHYGA